MNICAKLNMSALITPPSAGSRTLAANGDLEFFRANDFTEYFFNEIENKTFYPLADGFIAGF